MTAVEVNRARPARPINVRLYVAAASSRRVMTDARFVT